ncbi:MAG: hypothetical protein H7Y11_11270 [Armatimonadetes bacterium]|nr:hypothetical protein [Anaerolineae bacterium]
MHPKQFKLTLWMALLVALPLLSGYGMLAMAQPPIPIMQPLNQPLAPRDATVGTGTPASCTETAFVNALDEGGLINFNCGPAPHTIILTTTKIFSGIDINITLDGAGLISLSGGGAIRLFEVYDSATLTLSNMNIINGFSEFDAGAILNQGILNVEFSTFQNSTANTRSGGAIFTTIGGQTNVFGSTFQNNMAGERGGALYVAEIGILNVANSTFIGNMAQLGGAIRAFGISSIANITNSTFSGNQATINGGSLGVEDGGIIRLRNSILTNPIIRGHCAGGITDGGSNVVHTTVCGGIVPVSTANPLLGALTGSPAYYPLETGSPAIDVVVNCTYLSDGTNPLFAAGANVTIDQAGKNRPLGTKCEAGSFEYDPTPTPTVTLTPTPTATVFNVTNTPTVTRTPSPTLFNVTNTPTATPTITLTPSITFTPSATFTGTLTDTPTHTPTETASATLTETPTTTPSATTTPRPSVELLTNGGFESKLTDGKPDLLPWAGIGLVGDKIKCNKPGKVIARSGDCAFKFKGSETEASKIRQDVNLAGFSFQLFDELDMRVFIRATSETTAGKVKLTVKYGDGTPKGKVSFDLLQTSAYTRFGGVYTLLSTNLTRIRVQVSYRAISGKIYADDASLLKYSNLRQVEVQGGLLPLPRTP